MKVALVITGQLRTYNLCKHIIKGGIIDRYDTDVFLSIDKSNTYQWDYLNPTKLTEDNDIRDAIAFFNPCEYYICESYDEIYKEHIKELNVSDPTRLTPLKNYRPIFEQYYMVKQGYTLLINHIEKTGKHYDIVVRMRFDTIIWPKSVSIPSDMLYEMSPGHQTSYIKYNTRTRDKIIDISKNFNISLDVPLANEISVVNWCNNGNESWVNEQFWIHSSELITTVHKYYDELFGIINTMLTDGTKLDNIPFVEMWFYRFLQKYRVKLVKSSFIVPFCREAYA
jgi:hypothetical protein